MCVMFSAGKFARSRMLTSWIFLKSHQVCLFFWWKCQKNQKKIHTWHSWQIYNSVKGALEYFLFSSFFLHSIRIIPVSVCTDLSKMSVWHLSDEFSNLITTHDIISINYDVIPLLIGFSNCSRCCRSAKTIFRKFGNKSVIFDMSKLTSDRRPTLVTFSWFL